MEKVTNNEGIGAKLSCILFIFLFLNDTSNFCECKEQGTARNLPESMKQKVFQDNHEFLGVNITPSGQIPRFTMIPQNPNITPVGNSDAQLVPVPKDEGRTFGILYDLVSTLVWSLFMLNGIVLIIAVDYLIYVAVSESYAKRTQRHRRSVEENAIDRIASRVFSAIG